MVLHQSMIALQSNLDYPDFDYWDFFSRRLLCRLRVRALLLLLKAKKNSLLVQCRSRVKIIGGAHHERQSHEVLGSPGECSSGKFLLGGPGPPRPLPTLRHCSPLFNAVVLKRIWLRILIMTSKYS